jgi:3-deoxy-D-manno-octulosonic acid (KDO) 8-phosphate synthase
METTTKKRKKRSDRTHIIYQITNTVTQEIYIGVAVKITKDIRKTLHNRWLRHIYKATVIQANFTICESIRTYGVEVFEKQIIKTVRGKKEAFKIEAEIINNVKPQLNTRMQKCAIA